MNSNLVSTSKTEIEHKQWVSVVRSVATDSWPDGGEQAGARGGGTRGRGSHHWDWHLELTRRGKIGRRVAKLKIRKLEI